MNKQRIILFLLLSAALWGLPRRAAAQIFAVRANALAACGATLNAGAEAALTDNWSLELSGYWNPVQTASLSMNFHAVQLGGRYWFYESFVGHFLGQHLTYADYDLGSRTRRYKGHAYGLGVSYGYAWMLSKRWNVAVEAGVSDYWRKYVGLEGAVVGIDRFGECGPAAQVFKEFGFTVENIVAKDHISLLCQRI